jgi:hypothetical protein
MEKQLFWGVEVYVGGQSILRISEDSVCGKPEFTDAEKEVIRKAAQNLLGFIGEERDGKAIC